MTTAYGVHCIGPANTSPHERLKRNAGPQARAGTLPLRSLQPRTEPVNLTTPGANSPAASKDEKGRCRRIAPVGVSMSSAVSSPPEQAQLVNVRQRQYVVTEVVKSTLPASPLHPSDNGAQHLVSLSSVEDDALGE